MEQTQQVFHFSKLKKANPRQKQHPIVISFFSASMQTLINLCWVYGIPVTLCMPRLLYHEPTDDSIYLLTYKLTSAPVRVYVAAEKAGRSFRMMNPEHESIQDEPCWKLGGFGMCYASQPGQLLGADNDAKYIEALEESSFAYLMSVFGISHQEYPPQPANGGVDLLTAQRSMRGENTQPVGMIRENV